LLSIWYFSSGFLPRKYPIPHAVASDTPQAKIMLPSAIGSAFDRGTKLVGARAKQRDLVPKYESITNGKEDHLADFGLVMGRSFRVGWGPGFVLVHSGSPLGKKSSKTSALVQSSHTGDTLFSKSRLATEAQEGSSPFGVNIERVNIAEHLKHDSESALVRS
jgi:nuclear pore complex protein Nup98-Nup96